MHEQAPQPEQTSQPEQQMRIRPVAPGEYEVVGTLLERAYRLLGDPDLDGLRPVWWCSRAIRCSGSWGCWQ